MSTPVSSRRGVKRSHHRRSAPRFGVRRQLAYLLCAELVMLTLSRLPRLGTVAADGGPAVRFIALPLVIACLLARWKIDGRPAHGVVRSLLVMWLRPTRVIGWRAAPTPHGPVVLGPVTIAADEHGSRLRPAVINGPARLLVRSPFTAHRRWRSVRLESQPGPPRWRSREVLIDRGQRVVIR